MSSEGVPGSTARGVVYVVKSGRPSPGTTTYGGIPIMFDQHPHWTAPSTELPNLREILAYNGPATASNDDYFGLIGMVVRTKGIGPLRYDVAPGVGPSLVKP